MSNSPSFKDVFLKGAVIFNPVLVQLVGLCPVVAASTSLKSAVMLSIVACAELIAVCVIASALIKRLPRWVRVPLYFVIGLVLICPVLWYIETQTLTVLSLGMKIYIPLIAINSVVAVHCEQFAVKNSVKLAFYDAAAVGIGVAAVFIVVGAVREVLGSSSIGGIEINLPVVFKGMTLPFGCLILLGFMAAALKAFVTKKYPEYSDMRDPLAAKPAPQKAEVQENITQDTPETPEVRASEPELPEIMPSEPDVPQKAPEAEPLSEFDGIKIRTEEEIEEFFRSLGIDIDEKGDE